MDSFVRRSRELPQPLEDTTSPGGGALQAVLARSFSRHRAEVCPEARTPGHIGIPGPPSLSRVAQVGCPPPPPADVASDTPAFRPSSVQELSPARIRWHRIPEQGGQG